MNIRRDRLVRGLVLGISVLSSSFAYGYSLLSCENKGGYETNCFLSEFLLAPKSDIERSFSVEYKMPCVGHEINIGIMDKDQNKFSPLKQTNLNEKLTIVGYGPLMTFDPDRAWTASADFQVGCQLDIKIVEADLSESEKKRLNLVIDTIHSQSDLVEQVLRLSSNVSLLNNIIAKLDVNSIADLLAEKFLATKGLADSYEKQGKSEAVEALRSVQDDLQAAICLNIALAEMHENICTEPNREVPARTEDLKKTITEKANDALSSLGTNSASIVKISVDNTTEIVRTFAELVAYSSTASAADATAKACPALKKLNIQTSVCK